MAEFDTTEGLPTGPTRPSRTPTVAGISTMFRTVRESSFVLVSHPDYVSEPSPTAAKGLDHDGDVSGGDCDTRSQVRRDRSRPSDGPNRQAVKNAIVIHGNDPYGGWKPSSFATDAEGRYRLPPCRREHVADRYRTGLGSATAQSESRGRPARSRLPLRAGKPVRLRVVDAAGKPVPEAPVHQREWRGSKSLYSSYNSQPFQDARHRDSPPEPTRTAFGNGHQPRASLSRSASTRRGLPNSRRRSLAGLGRAATSPSRPNTGSREP